MDIRDIVVEVKRLHNSGALKAFTDATLITSSRGEITLKGFRVIQKDANDPWIAPPSSSYTNKEGKQINVPFLVISKAFKKELDESILKEYSKG